MYAERPLTRLAGVAWELTASDPYLVLPDGCTDVIWLDGRLMVAGPDTRAKMTEPPAARTVGLRFAPGAGPAVFGVAASELRDARLPLHDLWPDSEVRELEERLASGAGAAALLENASVNHAEMRGGGEKASGWVAGELARGRPVAEVARRLGITERHLYRRSLDAFGYGAKTLQRILRLQRALTLIRAGSPAAIAARRRLRGPGAPRARRPGADRSHPEHAPRILRAPARPPLVVNRGPPPGPNDMFPRSGGFTPYARPRSSWKRSWGAGGVAGAGPDHDGNW